MARFGEESPGFGVVDGLVPDVPVSDFELTLAGGKDGLLVNSKSICRNKRSQRVNKKKAKKLKRKAKKLLAMAKKADSRKKAKKLRKQAPGCQEGRAQDRDRRASRRPRGHILPGLSSCLHRRFDRRGDPLGGAGGGGRSDPGPPQRDQPARQAGQRPCRPCARGRLIACSIGEGGAACVSGIYIHVPRISYFYGITIRMYMDEGRHLGRSHFHASYADYEASIDIDTAVVLAGSLPPRALRMIVAWTSEHRDELLENWMRARRDQPLRSIAPLR